MNNIYKESVGQRAARKLLKVSAVVIMVMVWILIDKGNIYGQSLSGKNVMLKQSEVQSDQAPLLRESDESDPGRGGDLPTDEGEDDDFVVRPNPVSRDLVFDFEFTVKSGIPYQVMDPLGRLADQGILEPGVSSPSIDFSRFKTGVYIVRLVIGDKMIAKRIVKQ